MEATLPVLEALSPEPDHTGQISRLHGPPDVEGTAGFPPDLLERARFVRAGSELAFEGEPSDCSTAVIEGWISLSKMLDDGRRQIIDIILPMDVAIPVAGDGQTCSCTVRALTDAIVAIIGGPLAAKPAHLRDFTVRDMESLTAAARARQAERLLRIGQGNAYERVAHALLELFVRLHAIRRTSGTCFHLPITQQHFGEFVGLSSVHVCRTLHRLIRNGVIDQHGRDIVIHDLDALAAIARVNLERFRGDILPRTA